MSRPYVVVSANMVTPTVLVLTLFKADRHRAMEYEPGQYVTMSFKRHGRPTPARCFSLTSSPHDKGWLQLGLRIEGDFTQAAAKSIHRGDVVTIDGPFGGFSLSPARDRVAVMLAGGIGITPFMSMARYAAEVGLDNEILLVYSSSNQDDVPFANELMQLDQRNPHFHVVFAVSKGPLNRFAGHRAVQGRITAQLLDGMLGSYYRDKTFFLCGPTPFMDGMTDMLRSRRVPRSRIMSETFSRTIPNEKVWLGQPSQIYALTAMSMLLGTGLIIDKDFQSVLTKKPVEDSGGYIRVNDGTTSASSREDIIDQTIGELVTVNDDDAPADDGTTPVIGTTGTPPKTTNSSGSSSGGTKSSGTTVSGGSTTKSSSGTKTSPSPTPSPTPTSPSPSPSRPSPAPTPTPPAPTPTPTPTPTPSAPKPIAPTLSLSSNKSSIDKGDSATLSWSVNGSATDPVTCTASGGWSGTKGRSGSQSVSPSSSTAYAMTCSNSAGSSNRSVVVTVVQPTPPPPPPPPPPTPPPSSGGS